MAALNLGRALLQACKQGALADVKACTARLLAIPDAKDTNPPIKLAMGAAAYVGQTDTLRYLIASLPRDHWRGCSGPWDPRIFHTSTYDQGPPEWYPATLSDYVVYKAAAGGAPSVMQLLIDAGLGLNHEVEHMGSPLGIAITNGKLDLIRFLLAKGADPNNLYPSPRVSLLYMAALCRSTVIMQLLLDHGATIRGSEALAGAAEAGCIEAAALALESGADVNEVLYVYNSGEDEDVDGTALHAAVQHEQEAMVEFLLRRGARQDLLHIFEPTVKELAARIGNARIIRLLEQYEPSEPEKPL
jgi:hypothetical protein